MNTFKDLIVPIENGFKPTITRNEVAQPELCPQVATISSCQCPKEGCEKCIYASHNSEVRAEYFDYCKQMQKEKIFLGFNIPVGVTFRNFDFKDSIVGSSAFGCTRFVTRGSAEACSQVDSCEKCIFSYQNAGERMKYYQHCKKEKGKMAKDSVLKNNEQPHWKPGMIFVLKKPVRVCFGDTSEDTNLAMFLSGGCKSEIVFIGTEERCRATISSTRPADAGVLPLDIKAIYKPSEHLVKHHSLGYIIDLVSTFDFNSWSKSNDYYFDRVWSSVVEMTEEEVSEKLGYPVKIVPKAGASDRIIDGFKFVCTCESSPEQYTIYKDGVEVGYVRLRYGHYSVHPIVANEIQFDYNILNVDLADPLMSNFYSEEDRMHYLKKAAVLVKNYLINVVKKK